MSSPQTAAEGPDQRSWGYAEDFIEPGDSIATSRQAASDLGVSPLSTGTATALRFLARAISAKHVVEVGTGSGTSGLALFEGMVSDGILTSVDAEADRQDAARKAFMAAGIATSRFRLIASLPLDVLPKLRDGAYDMVFINGDKLEYVEYVAQALRLLRHGGMVVLNDALWDNKVADPENEDDEAVIIREALGAILDTEEFTSALLPVGAGLLAAIKA
ncbi:class I SAM-dependent methyltransferase [Aestuariimicrobium sp. p3-SID1156]|uniref:O-methyltransferase n=1 Tax=Aestuariimicrobium sp. p3-SID1156 TaxID=2916038 RepID=UPI00223ABDA5|nr:class I SAM-dependent methyltransferase [Aestuariimicrobium sp. p3-SID1156]MCT1459567.1 class I SAM-dependent methyltransferase [Aestuariimicrobium sp. p3-SID1156]